MLSVLWTASATTHATREMQEKRDIIRISNKDNKLLRDTPFICDFRFKNDLPEVRAF